MQALQNRTTCCEVVYLYRCDNRDNESDTLVVLAVIIFRTDFSDGEGLS